jgi:uncharacterized YigZ family protein
MKSIQEKCVHTLVEKKSEFINYLIPVTSVSETKSQLKSIQNNHPGASHYCSAYIIGNTALIQKYNDDGEPNQTAGLPMLEVLKKHALTNVLAVSVRYFGGIKLGAGGLIRAYAKGVAKNVEAATFTTLKTIIEVSLSIPFDEIGHVEHFIRKDYNLLDTSYTNEVIYTVLLLEKRLSTFEAFFKEQTSGKAGLKVLKKTEKFI